MVILGVNHRGNDATRALKRTVILTNLLNSDPGTSLQREKRPLERL